MYSQILQQMQEAVKAGRIRFRLHALDELADEDLLPADAINCILTGEIVEDQYDAACRQIKYVIFGDSLAGLEMGVVARWDDYRNVVIITAYQLQIDDYD